MKKTTNSVRIGDTGHRVTTRIEDEPSDPSEPTFRYRQYWFFRELAENQALLDCGYEKYQRLTIYHNGSAWVAESEAEIYAEDTSAAAPTRPV